MKWGLDFIGPIKLGGGLIGNKYVAIWVKVKAPEPILQQS
jgi:hypothetical protein